MLVVSDIDGLTQGTKIFRKGDVFVLDSMTAAKILSKNDLQIEIWQKQLYGRRVFRRASEDEILVAFKKKKITLDMMEPDERQAMLTRVKQVSERKAQLVDQLLETVGSEDDIDVTPKQKKVSLKKEEAKEEKMELDIPAEESSDEMTFEETNIDDIFSEEPKKTKGKK